jgi:hypothetical protein
MKRAVLMVGVLSMAAVGFGAEDDSPLVRLDSRITAELVSDRLHDASKAFVRVMWEDYRKAHLTPMEDGPARAVFGKMPDVQTYDEYLGTFGRGDDPSRAFLEILKDAAGRYYVKRGELTIPAVPRNKSIIFTMGDVVPSRIPQFGNKPYCTLEMFMIVRTGEEFFLGDPSTPPDKWMPLSKLAEKPHSDQAMDSANE